MIKKTDAELFSTETVKRAVMEQSELQLLYIAWRAAKSTGDVNGFSGLTVLFDSTSTKGEFREYMSGSLGIDDTVFEAALDDILTGKSAEEIAS